MTQVTSRILRIVAMAAVALATVARADEPRLQLDWPDGWEYRPAVRQGPAVHLQGRQRVSGSNAQQLALTIINTDSAQKPVRAESIKDLAGRLRDAALATALESEIVVHPFEKKRGYYFTATDKHFDARKPGDFKQLVEGVLLEAGYLINFTLLTNDASAPATQEMIRALETLSVIGADGQPTKDRNASGAEGTQH